MILKKADFKNLWVYLWIIATLILYWFVLYHVLKPFEYLLTDNPVGSRRYPNLFTHNFWMLFFHIFPSIVVAILLPWQFLIFRAKKIRKIHKITGYICLAASCFATPTAVYLSYTSDNTFLTSTGNALAAIGWCISIWIAFYFIRKKDIEKHMRWMIRTYVFFMDGAVLRVILTEWELFSGSGDDEYDPEAWLAWAATWALVEIMFLLDRRKKKRALK